MSNEVNFDIQAQEVDFDIMEGGKYVLSKASASALGGIKADAVTQNDAQPVNIDADGKLFTAKSSAGTFNLPSRLYIDEFVGTLKSYYDNRKKADGSPVFIYGHDTAIDGNNAGNELDCSAYVILGLMGIRFEDSPYASLNPSYSDESDNGNDAGGDIEDSDDAGSSLSGLNNLTPGDYAWAIDPKKILYGKNIAVDKNLYPVRTASQLCNMMEDAGWGVRYSDDFSDVRRGDIVFYARYAAGTDNYIQPERYRKISHVAVVSTAKAKTAADGLDEKYPLKHTMFEVTKYKDTGQTQYAVYNTCLEKRTVDKIVAICRPSFGAVSSCDASGSTYERLGTYNIDNIKHEGVYYLTSSSTGTLPAEVTSGTGCALRVESMYNRSGRIYAVIQTLYKMPTNSTDAGANAAVPAVYVRTNYCYRSATYTFTSTHWSAWKSIG